MNPIEPSDAVWQAPDEPTVKAKEGDVPAWVVSMLIHLGVLVVLTLLFAELPPAPEYGESTLTTVPVKDDFDQPEDFAYSDNEVKEIGGNSAGGGLGVADSLAGAEGDLGSVVSSQLEAPPAETGLLGVVSISEPSLVPPTGLELSQSLPQQGGAGVGVTGAEGAVDRITQEILDSLQKRKTLVVWMFDQSLSLSSQRAAIHKRLDRIYEELGVVEASRHPAFAKYEDKPLLSAVVAYASEIHTLTPQPTDQVAEIKAAIAGIKNDDSGKEMTFTTIVRTAEQYRSFVSGDSPRNVMFITFTDEVGDDSVEMLDRAVDTCRRYGIVNYVIGVPAPFGRKTVDVKWVDPDPKFNQEPQWTTLDQGPETLLPERVKIASPGKEMHHEETIDSGFGPFSLTRLAVSTGGLYFTVHPNRHTDRAVSRYETANLASYLKYFFDPEVMRKYHPDYVTAAEYQKRLRSNRAKKALSEASQATWVSPISEPQLRFRRRDEADLAKQLSKAQEQAAKLEPKVQALYSTLIVGKQDREKLTEPRWQAGYDLAMGQVLALKVRTEGYNQMLAKAKRGIKFQNSKNDTWDLRPTSQINAGSLAEKEAKQAQFYLQRVVEENPGTPWAQAAAENLAVPMGWEWTETFTNVVPPKNQVANNNNNKPPKPRDDMRNVIPPKPIRSPPKL